MSDSVTVLVSLVLLFLVVRYVLFGGQGQTQGLNTSTRRPVEPTTGAHARRGRHPVPPSSVDAVFSMFPHIPRTAIELDLSNTGSVEETCDRILSGALVAPLAPSAPPSAPSSGAMSASSLTDKAARPVFQNKPSPYLKPSAEPVDEPPKKWEASSDARQTSLRQRKEFMVQQARKKFLENQ
ncbi:hypothetical protein BASA50_003082 [Batrachochytrium salamandrivorans]|uniref:CUE domain-containing protein n=1 Tax=Batrachochytrium salamandrivorans TaxID=1357716 RepID=A0ABQ8FJI5_9FUNG|nr:hypothetical protein BASA60_011217 [Batrachochytrium salamandrivorans]KAH6568766.1 hypothetical protein BASA62_005265 [Batrachochytrium salamandrivorans]KAH6599385.1 hypothetical protein BASA50_003082 [Batrachochytrium salamandrivorans]KAH6602623.1 hypothetical protein BASA61_000956 [Batrachochytrium salamandrivorans]KAH9251974.1 hypothetical protein BASA81_010178 [Batrachochytrium salamandrivorans]